MDEISNRLARIEQALTSLEKTSIKLVEVVERLARIEERDESRTKSLNKAWERIDDLARRLSEIEKSEPMQAQATKWVMVAVWAIVGAAAAFVAKQLGVM
jgi:hypothetical protein